MKATVMLAPGVEAEAKKLLDTLADTGLPSDCKVIFRGRNTVAVTPDGELCIKDFRRPGLIKGFIYRYLRKPKALRAYENALRLRSLGISTPEPVGVVLLRGRLRQGRSYYVCRYAADTSELRAVEKRADFPAIAHALAQFMIELHRAGVMMKDFTMGNVLFRITGGEYTFTLVDINRMSFDVSDPAVLLTNFKALLDTPEGVAAVAREYGRLAGEADVDDFVARMSAVYAAHQVKVERAKVRKRIIRKLRGRRP